MIARDPFPKLIYELFVPDTAVVDAGSEISSHPYRLIAHTTGRHVNAQWIAMVLRAKGADTVHVDGAPVYGRWLRFERRYLQISEMRRLDGSKLADHHLCR